MTSEKISEVAAIKVAGGMGSLPRRLWRARKIAGRVSIRKMRRNPETGRWRVRIVDSVTGRFESVDTPYRDKRHAYEYSIKFAWEWARDHGLVDRETAHGDFADAYQRWMRELPLRAKSIKEYGLAGRCAAAHLPSSVAAITRQDVVNWVKALDSRGLKGNTIGWRLDKLRSFMKWAQVENYVDHDPTILVKAPRWVPRDGRALSYPEAQKLLAFAKRKDVIRRGKFYYRNNVGQHIYWFLLIALHTGLRKTNILQLRWSWIDFDERKIVIPARLVKSRRELIIPMHRELERKFRPYHSMRASDIVLGRQYRDVFRGFRGLCRRAGFKDLKIHDLRHTASTWFHMKLPWNYSEMLLGRTIPHIGGVYFHPPFWDLRDRIDTLPWLEVE